MKRNRQTEQTETEKLNVDEQNKMGFKCISHAWKHQDSTVCWTLM